MSENDFTADDLARAREYIENGKLDKAREIIDRTDTRNAEARYLLGRIFMCKCWYSEARRCFKQAVKLDPSNAEYAQALDDLNEFRKTAEYKQTKVKKKQMGSTDGFAEACCLCGCEASGTVCCEAVCDGCS